MSLGMMVLLFFGGRQGSVGINLGEKGGGVKLELGERGEAVVKIFCMRDD